MAEDDKVLNVAVVSAERSLWSGQAKSIVAKAMSTAVGVRSMRRSATPKITKAVITLAHFHGEKRDVDSKNWASFGLIRRASTATSLS